MAKGGARKGAGRKPGPTAATRARKTLAESITQDGITPLEIMTTTMRDLWREANAGDRPNLGKRMQAVMLAEKVAPYLHPRLSSMQVAGKGGGPVQVANFDASKLSSKALKELMDVRRAKTV